MVFAKTLGRVVFVTVESGHISKVLVPLAALDKKKQTAKGCLNARDTHLSAAPAG